MKYEPHPAVQILVWIMLALLVQRLQGSALVVACLLLMTVALKLCAKQMSSLIKRTRWIMLTLLIIYAYTTAGGAVLPQFGIWSPTWEGMADGATQLGRLLSVLAGLAILLAKLSQTGLISGLYSLMYPLRWFGVSRERFAVRLALTLGKAENTMRDTASDWRRTIVDAIRPDRLNTTTIELQVYAFSFGDMAVLLACAVFMLGVW